MKMNKKIIFKSENMIDTIKSADLRQLDEYAFQIRDYIIDTVSKNGGHLASNLGTVELTLALYYVFDFPLRDMLVWDTGHQTYTHKILTGRADKFNTLRQKEGISGFTNITESPFDSFGAGHVGTSIAAALGFEKAKRLSGEPGEVIAVIGDGALTSGNALESLNQVTGQKSNLKIIINDNGMSISDNVGSFANNFSVIRTGRGYNSLKKQLKTFLHETRLTGIESILEWIRANMKHNLLPDSIFDAMGFKYLGPIDGHDMETLIRVLSNIKDGYNKPVVLHVHTRKGRGLEYAEKSPNIFHGVGPIEKANGKSIKTIESISFSEAFGYTLSRYCDYDDKIVAITSAMDIGTGLHHFKEACPERFFDLGITEQSSIVFAAGMALKGFHPVYAVYSTFLQRAYDQIIHDIALQKIPLIVGIDRAGIVGSDGPTHHGVFDIPMLNPIPNIKLYSPDSMDTLVKMMNHLARADWKVTLPTFIRYPKEKEAITYEQIKNMIQEGKEKDPEKWELFQNASDKSKDFEVLIFACGTMFNNVRDILEDLSVRAKLIKVTSIKPLDHKLINELFNIHEKKIVITVEEGIKKGGFGENLMTGLYESFSDKILKADIIALENFSTHGTREELLTDAGLDSISLRERIQRDIWNAMELIN